MRPARTSRRYHLRMRKLIVVITLVFIVGAAAGYAFSEQRQAQPLDPVCGSATESQVRTTLYFGMSRPTGAVSELEWQLFLRDEVTPRFPDGLTVWDAQGQWKAKSGIEQERSKVLLLVHPDGAKARASVLELIDRYRKKFDQESVLWETARVCVAS
jgi:hypothetical protein